MRVLCCRTLQRVSGVEFFLRRQAANLEFGGGGVEALVFIVWV